MAEDIALLEARLRETENAVFEQESRAAALEVELFKSMDEQHELAMAEVYTYSYFLHGFISLYYSSSS